MKNRVFWREPIDPLVIRDAARQWDTSLWSAELLLRRHVSPEDVSLSLPMTSPGELPDMDVAVQVIRRHLEKGSRVRVYGDYDADGVTATAVLVRALSDMGFGSQVDYYIPNRFDEGYGLHPQAVLEAQRDGIALLITVDCGSSSPEAADLARQTGVDLVITDHHALPTRHPQALALVNPERQSTVDRLSGAGVALQLIRALGGQDASDQLYGIAAVGTVADVVPLLGTNRRLVARGLLAIQRDQIAGITALLDVAKRPHEYASAEDLGYTIGPRLNAAGRMGAADVAVRLLLTDDVGDARMLAEELSQLNRERQILERHMLDEAWMRIPRDDLGQPFPFTVIAADAWHQGVIGIIASRIRERLRRPCAVIAWSGSEGKGSARSVPGLDLIGHLRQSPELFSALGGHAGAAGFSLKRTDARRLSQTLSQGLPNGTLGQRFFDEPFDLLVDDKMDVMSLWGQLREWEPFGRAFEAPRFLVRGRIDRVRRIGSESQHVQLTLVDHSVRAVAFGMGRRVEGILQGDPVRFVATLETNRYRGVESPQWRIAALDVPWPRRSALVNTGTPDILPDRVVFVVNSDREVRRQAQRLRASRYLMADSLGDLALVVEEARRGVVSRLVVSQWRPWPDLMDWADAVVWLCRPRNLAKWEEAATLLNPAGQAWLRDGTPNVRTKAQRISISRDKLGRHWKGWQVGRAGLVPGRSVFLELELTPKLAEQGERRSVNNSYLYQLALRESGLDSESVDTGTVGKEEMHGVD